jgi:hypothetical protein
MVRGKNKTFFMPNKYDEVIKQIQLIKTEFARRLAELTRRRDKQINEIIKKTDEAQAAKILEEIKK